MKRHRALGEVARWELVRYGKPKQQAVGFVLTVAVLLGISFLGYLTAAPSEIEVAVVGAEHLPTLPDTAGPFVLPTHPEDEESRLRARVEDGDLDGLLRLGAGGSGELFTRRAPAWASALESHLSMALSLHRVGEAGLEPETLALIQAPFRLSTHAAEPPRSGAATLTALIALGLALYALFTGIGYIFASVTGEKQNRISEQVVSAIPAQTWIDGKILGLAGVAVVNIVNLVLALGAWFILRLAIWGEPIPMPPAVEQPSLIALAMLFVVLGFFLWFAFITAVAALVNDPHNSNRSLLMFLPMLAAAPAFLAVTGPDATWVLVLSLVPFTSFAVMPARVLVASVPAWEVVLSIALLVGGVLLARRIAGKVFRLAMLIYGKDPTWGEIRRWLREA
jgi:ABC-2 type transport system permease protein